MPSNNYIADSSTTQLSVGPIQNYVPGSTWFDLNKYNFLASQERVAVNLSRSNLWLVDASKLKMVEDYAPRVAFLNEGAGYRSPVNISAQGETFSQAIVFQDLSGRDSILPSANAPLKRGDWVQISNIAAGNKIDFSVIPNGVVNPQARPLSTNYKINPVSPYNPNAPVFWTAYADPNAENPLLIMAYEDIAGRGSDNDFNDGIIAVDIGRKNFESIFRTANFGQDSTINLKDAKAVPVPYEIHTTLGLVALIGIMSHRLILRQLKLLLGKRKNVLIPN
jgi:hypothetical protein